MDFIKDKVKKVIKFKNEGIKVNQKFFWHAPFYR